MTGVVVGSADVVNSSASVLRAAKVVCSTVVRPSAVVEAKLPTGVVSALLVLACWLVCLVVTVDVVSKFSVADTSAVVEETVVVTWLVAAGVVASSDEVDSTVVKLVVNGVVVCSSSVVD